MLGPWANLNFHCCKTLQDQIPATLATAATVLRLTIRIWGKLFVGNLHAEIPRERRDSRFFDSDCAMMCNAFVLPCLLRRCQGLAKCLESGAESWMCMWLPWLTDRPRQFQVSGWTRCWCFSTRRHNSQLLQNEVMTGKSKFGSACAFVEMVSISDSCCLVLSALLAALNYLTFWPHTSLTMTAHVLLRGLGLWELHCFTSYTHTALLFVIAEGHSCWSRDCAEGLRPFDLCSSQRTCFPMHLWISLCAFTRHANGWQWMAETGSITTCDPKM